MENIVPLENNNTENEERIVKRGLKCDFHIHSFFSKHKESKNITINSTIENLDVLIKALEKNEVEMAAITDHDVFSYDLYTKFKKEAKNLKLVLPGVEFTVAMKCTNGVFKQIHVITLFNDSDEEKIKNIEKVLGNGKTVDKNGKLITKSPDYDALNNSAYSQDKLIKLLDEIGLDVVMIAHQKKSMLTDQDAQKNDFNNLDEDEQNFLLFTEYFQALEFHDKKNELFNIKKKNEFKEDIINFITGSDCHDWECYPNHDFSKKDENKFRHTYLKCLPTFRGVSLALTEDSRIKLDDSFFSVGTKYLDEITISVNSGKDLFRIPMSKGINAIIGDNSIGKSLLIHKLTNYYRKDVDKDTSAIGSDGNNSNNIVDKYEAYLEKNGIKILSNVSQDMIYEFDSQGEIRKKFSQNKLNRNKFILRRKKENPDIEKNKNILIDYVNKYILNLKGMMDNNILINQLSDALVSIPDKDVEAKVLKGITFDTKDYDIKKTNKNNEINAFEKITKDIDDVKKYLSKQELENINKFLTDLNTIILIRKNEFKVIANTISIIELINNEIIDFNDKQTIPVDDKVIKLFNTQKNNVASLITSALEKKSKNYEFESPSMHKTIKVTSEQNTCGNLKIVTCANTKIIDDKYLENLFKSQLKKDKFKKDSFLSNDSLADAISRRDPSLDPWEDYLSRINEQIKEDFKEQIKLNYLTDSDDVDYSSGLNDKMYFEILANDDINEGIYFIDQPEDDVSQKSIRDNLISYLRRMGNKRQVILITHNPQFVVNLDVDNVIFMHKDDAGKVNIHYGALEYQNDSKEDILKDVAETLDGGVMTIRKRWKKYEKNIEDIIK